MALKREALEIGMGTDIRGGDYTKAAVRALRDALWHNSLTVATAVGKSSDDMQVEVLIGVPRPELVDKNEVLAVLPQHVDEVTARLTEAGETVHRIGEIVDGPKGCTVRGSAETWSGREAWEARHDA